MTMEKDLQAIKKELKALSKKVDKLVVAAGKSVKTKPVKKAAVKKTAPKWPR